jgi:DNA (cytosine-5)-methyltransferase 1
MCALRDFSCNGGLVCGKLRDGLGWVVTLKYLSVCSGIEAASVAWQPLGWKAAGFSEIEPFPCKVLARHYPDVTNFGDLTKYEQWNIEPGTVDVLIGGTPCQSFSIAGLRKGMADPRGNLALVYLGLVNHIRPRWIVWENVPGVLSSNCGRDFGSFLGALAELGYRFAYRICDAQYWGVAQRRRRVFVVGYLGDWRRAAAVLFEPKGGDRNTPARRKAGEDSAANVEECLAFCSEQEVADTITACNLVTPQQAGNNPTLVNPIYCCELGAASRRNNNESVELCGTLRAQMGDNLPVVYGSSMSGDNLQVGMTLTKGCSQRLDAETETHIIEQRGSIFRIRRIMPVEAERLQGFPDNYTDIQLNGKPTPDGPRYRALGNSMAVPVIRWIGEKIQVVDSI